MLHRILVILTLLVTTAPAYARAMPDSFADLVEELSPAVVNVSSDQVVTPPPSAPGTPPSDDDSADKTTSLGSGFIIDPKGYIVTNNHVLGDAEDVSIRLSDDTTLEATIIGRDAKTDLALLKVESKKPLPYVSFGDSDDTRVGDWVIVIGNPFGLGGSVSAGIISARARDIHAGPFDDFLQTDAAINRGNSGGPMFNAQGKVVGINTAIYSPSGGNIGIGFAVPSSLAMPVIKQLRDKGYVERGWLGVKIQEVTPDIAESIGLKNTTGAMVVGVTTGSPADKSGLIPGDVITALNGQTIQTMRKLPPIVAGMPINKKITLDIFRMGAKKNLEITIGTLDERNEKNGSKRAISQEDTPTNAKQILGMTLVPLDDSLRQHYEINNNVEGLLILSVEKSSQASHKGLQAGDVILNANQQAITDINTLVNTLTDVKRQGRASVLLLLSQRGNTRFIGLPIVNK